MSIEKLAVAAAFVLIVVFIAAIILACFLLLQRVHFINRWLDQGERIDEAEKCIYHLLNKMGGPDLPAQPEGPVARYFQRWKTNR